MSTRGAAAADRAPRKARPSGAAASSVPVKPHQVAGLRTLCMPSGCSTRPPKLTSTPWPRAVGLAANASASRRFLRPVGVRGVGAAHRAGQHDRGRHRRR